MDFLKRSYVIVNLYNCGLSIASPQQICEWGIKPVMSNDVMKTHGGDWYGRQDGNTALHLAVKFGNLRVAELLLHRGAERNLPNAVGSE